MVHGQTQKEITMADINSLVEQLGKLTLQEAADLANKLEDEWGVTAVAGMAPAVAEAPAMPAEKPHLRTTPPSPRWTPYWPCPQRVGIPSCLKTGNRWRW